MTENSTEPVWEAYVSDSLGFVIDPGTLALIEDEEAIWREYGDCIPEEITVARGDGKPVEKDGGVRFKSSHQTLDRIRFEVHDESANRAQQLWQAAQAMASGLNGDVRLAASTGYFRGYHACKDGEQYRNPYNTKEA